MLQSRRVRQRHRVSCAAVCLSLLCACVDKQCNLVVANRSNAANLREDVRLFELVG